MSVQASTHMTKLSVEHSSRLQSSQACLNQAAAQNSSLLRVPYSGTVACTVCKTISGISLTSNSRRKLHRLQLLCRVEVSGLEIWGAEDYGLELSTGGRWL
eukprot:scpid49614/ scgid28038/ 